MRVTPSQHLLRALTGSTLLALCLLGPACDKSHTGLTTPPPAEAPIANVYILPGATALGDHAFGDEPVVIFKGERMRWVNLDSLAHAVVTDTAAFPEFMTTGVLAPGGENSFVMNTIGTTKIHSTDHPQMTGTLVVKER